MTPLDSVTWALIVLGLYIAGLAVRQVIYGEMPYEALPLHDKLIYRYGVVCIGSGVFVVVSLIVQTLMGIFMHV